MQLIASPACMCPEKTESPLVLLFIGAITLELRVVDPDRAGSGHLSSAACSFFMTLLYRWSACSMLLRSVEVFCFVRSGWSRRDVSADVSTVSSSSVPSCRHRCESQCESLALLTADENIQANKSIENIAIR